MADENELQHIESEIAAIKAAPSELLAKVHAEVDTFWNNYFVNAAGRIDTSVHNYLQSEKEALKARIANLFL